MVLLVKLKKSLMPLTPWANVIKLYILGFCVLVQTSKLPQTLKNKSLGLKLTKF